VTTYAKSESEIRRITAYIAWLRGGAPWPPEPRLECARSLGPGRHLCYTEP